MLWLQTMLLQLSGLRQILFLLSSLVIVLQANKSGVTTKDTGTGGSAKDSVAKKSSHDDSCEVDWAKLFKLDLNPKKSSQAGKGGRYILAQPATGKNRYSLWAYFLCKRGTLVHEHCRFGDEGQTGNFIIPISKFFFPISDSIVKDDGAVYACREGSTADKLTPVVRPTDSWRHEKRGGEDECRRFEGSRWCGAPPEIANNGCLIDWLALQKNTEIILEGPGAGRLHLFFDKMIDWVYYSMDIKLTCDDKKQLKPELCYPQYNEDRLAIPAGQFATTDGIAYACPLPAVYKTSAELGKAMVITAFNSLAKQAETKLKAFKPFLPPNIDSACAADWNVLIDDGRRDIDSSGYVEIVKKISRGDLDVGHHGTNMGDTSTSGMWAFFVCKKTTGKLSLDHCRIGETGKRRVDAGKYKSAEGYYFNCGPKETTAATVDKQVTRMEFEAAAGLVAA